MLDPYEVRKDFPILERKVGGRKIVYFDNAATTQKPIQVITAIKEFYEHYNANIHRGLHTLSQEASEAYEEAHEVVAKFINARGTREIVFVKNTTEAINLVAMSYGLRFLSRGDEVVTTLMEHHSNMLPWLLLEEVKGVKVKFARVREDGTLDLSDLEQKLTSKTKFVCVVHVSNVTGAINDVKELAKLAHDNGSLILVDGAQSVPHLPVDVKDLDCDFLAFSGHKMLGPTGIGVLYGKEELLAQMQPAMSGGGTIRSVVYDSAREACKVVWSESPWKFEAGTPNIAGAVGLKAAVEYLKRIGMENVAEHERKLVERTLKGLEKIEGAKVYGPRELDKRAGIVPFNVEGLHPHDLAVLLDHYGVAVRSGYHCAQPLHEAVGARQGSVRASFYIYNTLEEIEYFLEILRELKPLG